MTTRNVMEIKGINVYISSIDELQHKHVAVAQNGVVVITDAIGEDSELRKKFLDFATPFTNKVWECYEASYSVMYIPGKDVHIWAKVSNAKDTLRAIVEYVQVHLTMQLG